MDNHPIKLTKLELLNNPARFRDPFRWNVEYEAVHELKSSLEWKVIYAVSGDTRQDQILDTVNSAETTGKRQCVTMQAKAPDASKLSPKDLVGSAALLIECWYENRKFLHVGYYDDTNYEDGDPLLLRKPRRPHMARLWRFIKEPP